MTLARENDTLSSVNEPRNFQTALKYFGRAMLLRCPVCGIKPIFMPLSQTRSIQDWLRPLDGCPRCGYPYEREPGYFLMAIWAVNYGFGGLFGVAIYLFLIWRYDPPLMVLLVAVLAPTFFFNVFFARHSKALFIALDHFFDPHEREGGDDGGNLPINPEPPADNPPSAVRPKSDSPVGSGVLH